MKWLRGGEVSEGRWVCFPGFRLRAWSLQLGFQTPMSPPEEDGLVSYPLGEIQVV